MAIIQVEKGLRIKGTERAWQVEQAKVIRGRVRWEPSWWFSTLPAAIHFLVERDIRTAPLEGLAEVIEHAKSVAEMNAEKIAEIDGDTQGFAAGRAHDGKSNTCPAQPPARISLVGRS